MPAPRTKLSGQFPSALVTGASSGIGRAIAESLLAAGLTVHGTSRRPDRPDLHPDIHWLPFEGDSLQGIHAFLREQPNLLSSVDLLINNAGGSFFGSIDAVPRERITGLHNLLLEGPVQLTRAVLPGMRERGRGAIVNVSSLAALFPLPYMATYSACKAGLSAFTRSLLLTERGRGLVLIDFQPGDYGTAFNAAMDRHGRETGSSERAWKRLEENMSTGPPPERAAKDLMRALARGRSGVVYSGGFFQRCLAPLGARILPTSCLLRAIGRYYRIQGRQ